MKLEFLANELLLDLFEFLTIADIFRAFHGLNPRFDAILLTHIELSRRVDLRSISKHHFDIMCRHYLPSVADRILCLCLSDDDETPGQREQFRSRRLTLRQFSHVQCLSLIHFGFKQTMDFITIRDDHLTHLNLSNCYYTDDRSGLLVLFNKVWSLSQLTHFQFDVNSREEECVFVPTMVSLSLKYLSIAGLYYGSRELAGLLEQTPRLRFLAVNFKTKSDPGDVTFPLSSLTTLKISYQGSRDDMTLIFERMPHLHHLTVEADDLVLSGDDWETIIVDHLPKLKVFQFALRFQFEKLRTTRDRVNELFKTYQSHFWISEHQWVVRYHAYFWRNNNIGVLYLGALSNQWQCVESSVFEHLDGSQSSFFSIAHLSMELPCSDHFWLVVAPKLDRLRMLDVSFSFPRWPSYYCNNVYLQFQSLLDQAPRLYSLKLVTSMSILRHLLKSQSESVRRLDFRACDHYWNTSECNVLIHSSLGLQCEVLRIDVQNRTNLLDLINSMTHLRALNVRCQEDTWSKGSSGEDQLVEWLRCRLRSECIVRRDMDDIRHIQLWTH